MGATCCSATKSKPHQEILSENESKVEQKAMVDSKKLQYTKTHNGFYEEQKTPPSKKTISSQSLTREPSHKTLKSNKQNQLPPIAQLPQPQPTQEPDIALPAAPPSSSKQIGNHTLLINQVQEDQMVSQEQGLDRQKIDVRWADFIKLKRKNVKLEYEIIKEQGRGAFGTVSKVMMKQSKLLRAMKSIKKSSLIKQDEQKIFSEMLILKQMDHPNIIKLHQVYQWKNYYYLILQLCQGGELFDRIRNTKQFSQRDASDIMKSILSTVVYMHKLNIVHRDLKPENMLFVSSDSSSHLKLIDFGTARKLPANRHLTKQIGTAYYIAPEVLGKCYDEKCDVWSCGVIMYILLCGYPPFRGASEKDILEKVRYGELKFDEHSWTGVSSQAIQLIKKMLQRNPEKRISAQQAYNSPWIQNTKDRKPLPITTLQNMRTFHFRNRLKAVVMTYVASQLISNQDKSELQLIFRSLDTDGDGVIQRKQLVNAFENHYRNHENINYNNILQIIDTNNSGKIDFTEFIVAASKEQKLLNLKKLQNAFSYFDIDHSGYITIEQIKVFLNAEQDTTESIKKLFDMVDLNSDGKISRDEFIELLLKHN